MARIACDNRAAAFLAALFFLGCAPFAAYRTPCTVRVDVTLAKRYQANEVCRNKMGPGVIYWDDGRKVLPHEMLAGCFILGMPGQDVPELVVQHVPDIEHEELGHLFDASCK